MFERDLVSDNSNQMERNRISAKMRLRKDTDRRSWRQRPISTVNLRPLWNLSSLKDG